MATFRNELAKRHLQDVLSIDRSDSQARLLLGKIFLMQGDPDSALIYAREGLSFIRRKRERLLLKDAHELLGDINRLAGQNGEAVTHYNLAYDIIKDYRYGEVVDLIRYKQALVAEADFVARDSLYARIAIEADSRFVKDLCIYQLASNSIKEKNNSKTLLYFGKVAESNDYNSLRFLRWRALYNMGLVYESDDRERLLKHAEKICGNYPPEPDYIKDYYDLNEERADLFFMLAEIYSRRGDLTAAVNCMETGFSARICGRHFSVGCLDSAENDILDNSVAGPPDSVAPREEEEVDARIYHDSRYRVLWGTRADSVEAFQSTMDVNEAALRFYRIDSSYMAVYLAADSIGIIKYEFNGNDLRETLTDIGDLMANQSRADSVLEKWYTAIIGPFESLLLSKEKIDLIPDGFLHLFPLEALKMPQGDYLSEMFTVERLISLRRESSDEIGEGVSIAPIFTASYNPDIRYAQYMVEPFSRPTESPDYGARFYAGGFSFFQDSSEGQPGLVCAVRAFKEKDLSDLALQAFLSLREGNDGFAYPIWDVSDEVKSTYYWNLVKNLSEGAGFWKSWNNSRSYLFGHFEGLPYYWGANVYVSLN